MRISRKRAWPDLREELLRRLEGRDVVVSGPDELPCASWSDGPAFSTVGDAIGTVPGWALAFWPDFLPRPEPEGARSAPLLLLRRSFGDEALAVAVVRFAGSNVRPFDSGNPAHRAPMTAILDVDDPAHCDYPIVARVAEMLLDHAGPRPADPDVDPADRLSRALTDAGYEDLWNRAWLDVDL